MTWNPIELLVNAYLKGREWQMKRLDEQNKQLKRIAELLEWIVFQQLIANQPKKKIGLWPFLIPGGYRSGLGNTFYFELWSSPRR